MDTTALRYYVIAGKLVDGHWAYTPEFAASPNAVVEAREVAIDETHHAELFAIGQLTSAAVSALPLTTSLRRSPTARDTRVRHSRAGKSSNRLGDLVTGASSGQAQMLWNEVDPDVTGVTEACVDQGYRYDSETYIIDELAGGSCGTRASTDWQWYIVPGSVSNFGPTVYGQGEDYVDVETGQNASMTWPCMYNDTNCYNGKTPDCQVDYNSNVLRGYISGNQYEVGTSEIWTPSGRINCEELFVEEWILQGDAEH